MQSNDDTKNRTNIANTSDNKREDIEDWNNEHGDPSNDFLQSLAEDNNLEKLRSIASDLDVKVMRF